MRQLVGFIDFMFHPQFDNRDDRQFCVYDHKFLSLEFYNVCHQRGNNKFCSDVDSHIECLEFLDSFEFLDNFDFLNQLCYNVDLDCF